MAAPRSGRARSGSRVQTLRRGWLPSTGVAGTVEQWQSSGQSPHGSPKSRLESPPPRLLYQTSINHRKTPARSYFHQSSYGSYDPIEVAQDNSHDVREDTAELASWALSDRTPRSTRPSSSHSQRSPTSVTAQRRYEYRSLATPDHDILSQPESDHSPRPRIVSEPASPGSLHSSHKSLGLSALSEMFRRTLSSDEENTDTEQDDQREDGTGLRPVTVQEGIISQPHEQTILLLKKQAYVSDRADVYGTIQDVESQKVRDQNALNSIRKACRKVEDSSKSIARTAFHPKSWNLRALWIYGVRQPLELFPSILLGLLLNILDALSYGMILFPLGQPVFSNLGPDGISMFYVSCIVSQLVYSLGGSIFKGGIGSEMIEVVPFFHKMAFTILEKVGSENPKVVLATTVLSYSMSSVLTGAVFFLMGKCKLGTLIGFFPRHILIGCIGGVGWFLVATGVEVSARLSGNLEYNLSTLQKLFQISAVCLWVIPLALAFTLQLIKRWCKNSMLDALYFVMIFVIFYFFELAIPNVHLPDLRDKGWVFQGPAADVPFYHFYTLYDFGAVDWAALANTIPTMLSLTFFGVIHVPINVPALGLNVGEDNVDVDRELKAHGLSNALSGFCGSIQNYLVYTNSVLFMRSGGNSRVAGTLLAVATFGILIAGPVIIGYIPVMVVSALIFFLGIELLKEALVETWGKVQRIEYLTIIIIVVTMGAWDFVIGIIVGILLACVSLVLQTSRVSAIRNSLSGSIAASTVRRHPIQNRFLQDAGRQIYVVKLAGFLFFGTIVGVEKQIRNLLLTRFEREPIRFLVLDLHNVDGVDFSAAEAFVRINRILRVKGISLIVCGTSIDTEIGKALCNVGLFEAEDKVQYFGTLNSALEHCENILLITLYQQRGALVATKSGPNYLKVPKSSRPPLSGESFYSSPRRNDLQEIASATFNEQDAIPHSRWQEYSQPLQLLLQTFSTVSDKPEDFWYRAVSFFERKQYSSGSILYQRGELADGFFLLESGMLKAEYMLPQLGKFSELIVEGTTCGELPFFSGTKRTSTTTAERDCVTWMLNERRWEDLQADQPDIAQELLKISLKLTSERMDAITKHMLLTSGYKSVMEV